MNRRGFLGAILAAGVAPAVVKYANLMPVFARTDSGLIVPEWGTGIASLLMDKQTEYNRIIREFDLAWDQAIVELPKARFVRISAFT